MKDIIITTVESKRDGDSYELHDENGNFLTDTSSIADAVSTAKEMAEANDIDFIKLQVQPVPEFVLPDTGKQGVTTT